MSSVSMGSAAWLSMGGVWSSNTVLHTVTSIAPTATSSSGICSPRSVPISTDSGSGSASDTSIVTTSTCCSISMGGSVSNADVPEEEMMTACWSSA